jgi:hypothetical protein
MKTHIGPISAAALAGVLISGAAFAQAQPCAERDKIIQRLNNTYGETVQSIGLGANNGIMEVYASEETGSWTITVTMPDGMTCLIASGQAFEGVKSSELAAKGDDV